VTADLLDLWNQTKAFVEREFGHLTWAGDEITQAQARHPDAADILWHAWPLLGRRDIGTATMAIEFVYRGHVRELLDRLAAGQDTRPATDAEICLVCSEMSLQAPLTHAAAGLYFTCWLRAFPGNPVFDGQADEAEHAARSDGYEMRELERMTRRRATVPARVLPKDLHCDGNHDGTEVACRFASALFAAELPTPVAPRARRSNGKPRTLEVAAPDEDPDALATLF
jgi:hypothetical protein